MPLSNSSHFPLRVYSNDMKPISLPPGRARLSTKPAPTGSLAIGKTIGTVRVACSNGLTLETPWARMTSGANAANSAAYLRASSARITGDREDDRHGAGRLQQRSHARNAVGKNDVGRKRGQFRRVSASLVRP